MFRIFSATSVVLLFVSLLACKSTKNAADNASVKENALLWSIEGNGIKQPSYLYGTIHMIPAEDYFLPEGTLTAIDKSQKMVFEIDLADMNDMSKMMGIMGKVFMKDGKTLKDLLNEEDYSFVTKSLDKIGLPIYMLEKIKPMFLSAFAYGDMNDLKGGGASSKIKSYEFEFYNLAQTQGKKTGGLETIDFQLSVFDQIPYEDQAKMLVETLKGSNTEDDEFKKMVALYKAQDITKMVDMMGQDTAGIAKHQDLLLNNRNQNWIPKIGEEAKLQPTFFAVGAGHLGGKEGVINLLRKAGYVLKPVKK